MLGSSAAAHDGGVAEQGHLRAGDVRLDILGVLVAHLVESTRGGFRSDGHGDRRDRDGCERQAEAVELEHRYALDTMPRGVLGMNAAMMEDYLKFIANRRLTQLGLPEQFKGVTNPFPWMSEIMDLRKEKNFFETRVIEYQTGGALKW